MATLKNVVFAYTKIQQAAFKYGSTTEKEYSVDCIVDKATAKAWNKQYPKQKAKEVDNEEFVATFKIDPPFYGDEQYVIKLRRPAQYKDGTSIPDSQRPRVFEKKEDGTLVDITKDKLVANGSRGAVSFEETPPNDFGVFARLKAIRVDELVEYKKAKAGVDFSELGEVVSLADYSSDVPEREMSEAQKADQEEAKATPKPKSKPVPPPVDDDGDEIIPF